MSNIDKKNVVIFGESGTGKSSLVNRLLGENKAQVSDKAVGCTFSFQKYETANFNLFDTVGLSEGSKGTVKEDFAIRALVQLLKSLADGVSLLVFVIEKGRIKKSLEENYNLFVNTICMQEVPVVLVITHCEMETVLGTWWLNNASYFAEYGMEFVAVVSGTALQADSVPAMMKMAIKAMNDETVRKLSQAIRLNALDDAWTFKGGWQNWFCAVLKRMILDVSNWFSKGIKDKIVSFFSLNEPNFVQRLTEYFQSLGRNFTEAHEMAQDIARDIV